MFWACFVNTGIYLYTLRGRTPDLAMLWPRSPPALYVLHVRVLVTRDRAVTATGTVATEVPVTVPLHAWSGQGQLSHWTLTSDNIQSVGEGTHHHHQVTIIIIMAKKAGGRKTHMYSSHTLRASVPCRPFEQPETRVEVSNSLSECVV